MVSQSFRQSPLFPRSFAQDSTASPRNILGWNTVGNQYQEVVLGKQHYSGRYLHQQPNGEGTMIYGDSCTYQGEWKMVYAKVFGTLHIPQRGTWQGYWHADTLQSGTFNNLTQEYNRKVQSAS